MVVLLVCSFEQQNSNKNVKSPFYLRNNWGLLSQYRYEISAAKIVLFLKWSIYLTSCAETKVRIDAAVKINT